MPASKDGGDGIRGRVAEAYQTTRERTFSAYETARDRAADVTRQATDQISVYPVAAVVGGLALGALIGLVVPRSRRETELLAPAGKRITEAARGAAEKGVESTRERIDEITGKVVGKVGHAVVEAVGGKD